MNLFVVLVGKTSRARKGTSKNRIGYFFEGIDQAWTEGTESEWSFEWGRA